MSQERLSLVILKVKSNNSCLGKNLVKYLRVEEKSTHKICLNGENFGAGTHKSKRNRIRFLIFVGYFAGSHFHNHIFNNEHGF